MVSGDGAGAEKVATEWTLYQVANSLIGGPNSDGLAQMMMGPWQPSGSYEGDMEPGAILAGGLFGGPFATSVARKLTAYNQYVMDQDLGDFLADALCTSGAGIRLADLLADPNSGGSVFVDGMGRPVFRDSTYGQSAGDWLAEIGMALQNSGSVNVADLLTAHGPNVGLADYLADMFGFGGQYGSNPLYMAGPDLSVAELIGELIYNLASASPLYMPGPGISLSEGLQAAFFNSPMMGSPLFYNSSGNPMLGGAPIGELIGDLVSGEGNLLDSPLFDPNNQAGVGEMVGYVWSALNMAMAPDSTFPPFFDQSDGTPLADILDMGLANAQNRLDYIETRLVASNDDLGVAEYFDQTNAIGPLYDSVNGLSVADLLSGEVGPGLGYVISALSDIDTKLAAVKAVTDQMTLVDVAEGGKGLQVVDTTAGGGG